MRIGLSSSKRLPAANIVHILLVAAPPFSEIYCGVSETFLYSVGVPCFPTETQRSARGACVLGLIVIFWCFTSIAPSPLSITSSRRGLNRRLMNASTSHGQGFATPFVPPSRPPAAHSAATTVCVLSRSVPSGFGPSPPSHLHSPRASRVYSSSAQSAASHSSTVTRVASCQLTAASSGA